MTMFDLDRRTIMAGALAGAALSSAARAQSFPLPSGFTRFPIWPGKAPGGDRVTVREVETLRRPDSGPDDGVFAHIVTPTLTMLRPEAVGAKPNGAAMLLFPGGAREVFKRKGEEYQLFWGESADIIRLAARCDAVIIPFSGIGGDESFKMSSW